MVKTSIIKGTIYLTIAQVIFVVVGYIINLGLGKFLGPSNYWIFSVVISLITTINLILTTGIPRAVSKFISEDSSKKEAVKITALKLQLVLSAVIFFFYFIFAKQISLLLRDINLTRYIQISAFIIPSYSLYSLIIGYLNGLREYRKQALNQIIYFLTKLVLIFFFVILGFSVLGAIVGFTLAPITGFLASMFFIKFNIGSGTFYMKKIINFATPIIFFSLATNLILSIDLFSVKALLTTSNEATGFYSAASMIARVICYLPGALSTAIFPAISSSTYNGQDHKTKNYIIKSIKLTLLFLIPTVIFISLGSKQLVSILFFLNYRPPPKPSIFPFSALFR